MTLAQLPFEFVFSAFIPSLDPYWESFTSLFVIYNVYFYIKVFDISILVGIFKYILTVIIATIVILPVVALGASIYLLYK